MKEEKNKPQQSDMKPIKEVKEELKVEEAEVQDHSISLNVSNTVKKTVDFLASSFHIPPASTRLDEELVEKIRPTFQNK